MDQETRNAEIVTLADKGVPQAEIARSYGLSKQRINQIVARARDSGDPERAEHRKFHRKQVKKLLREAERPQPKSTATGFTQANILTCSCGSRADRMRDHAETCTVQPVYDAQAAISARKEARLNMESIRRLDAIDKRPPSEDDQLLDEALEWVRSVLAENQRLKAELAERGPVVRAQITA